MTLAVVAFANGDLGQRIVRHLAMSGGLRAVMVHPPARASRLSEIASEARAAGATVVEAESSSEGRTAQLRGLGAVEIGVSAGFGFILKEPEYAWPRFGTVNVHTSLLPRNRGAHPNAWAIATDTPAGVTIHFVDAGVDTGDILVQTQTLYSFADTARTLYDRLINDADALFKRFWPQPESFWQAPPRLAQRSTEAAHRVKDLEAISLPGPNETTTVREILRILRARTFTPHPGARIEIDGRRFRVRVEISADD